MSKLIFSKFTRLSSTHATSLKALEHLNLSNNQCNSNPLRMHSFSFNNHRTLMAHSTGGGNLVPGGSTGFIPSRHFSSISSGSGSGSDDNNKNRNNADKAFFAKDTVKEKLQPKKLGTEKNTISTLLQPNTTSKEMEGDPYYYFDPLIHEDKKTLDLKAKGKSKDLKAESKPPLHQGSVHLSSNTNTTPLNPQTPKRKSSILKTESLKFKDEGEKLLSGEEKKTPSKVQMKNPLVEHEVGMDLARRGKTKSKTSIISKEKKPVSPSPKTIGAPEKQKKPDIRNPSPQKPKTEAVNSSGEGSSASTAKSKAVESFKNVMKMAKAKRSKMVEKKASKMQNLAANTEKDKKEIPFSSSRNSMTGSTTAASQKPIAEPEPPKPMTSTTPKPPSTATLEKNVSKKQNLNNLNADKGKKEEPLKTSGDATTTAANQKPVEKPKPLINASPKPPSTATLEKKPAKKPNLTVMTAEKSKKEEGPNPALVGGATAVNSKAPSKPVASSFSNFPSPQVPEKKPSPSVSTLKDNKEDVLLAPKPTTEFVPTKSEFKSKLEPPKKKASKKQSSLGSVVDKTKTQTILGASAVAKEREAAKNLADSSKPAELPVAKSVISTETLGKKSSKKRDKFKMEQLTPEDCHRRLMFSTKLLLIIEDEPEILDNILWTDECNFNLPKLNPGIIKKPAVAESELLPQIAWCGITTKGTIGPYFFNSHVTDKSYLKMLETFVIPELQVKGYNLNELWFQQDGAPWHRSKIVIDFLKSIFDYRIISLGTKFIWPPRSQDLTPMDYFFWDYMKLKINFKHSKYDLQFQKGFRDILAKEVITASKKALQGAIYQVPERLEMCMNSNGGRIQHLLYPDPDVKAKVTEAKESTPDAAKEPATPRREPKKSVASGADTGSVSFVPPSRFSVSTATDPPHPSPSAVTPSAVQKPSANIKTGVNSGTAPPQPAKAEKLQSVPKPVGISAAEIKQNQTPVKPELNPTPPKPVPNLPPPPPSPSKPKSTPIRVQASQRGPASAGQKSSPTGPQKPSLTEPNKTSAATPLNPTLAVRPPSQCPPAPRPSTVTIHPPPSQARTKPSQKSSTRPRPPPKLTPKIKPSPDTEVLKTPQVSGISKPAVPPPPVQIPNASQLEVEKTLGAKKKAERKPGPKTCVNATIAEAVHSNNMSEDLLNQNYSFGRNKDREHD